MNLITLQDAVDNFKKLINSSILDGGSKGKEAMIRSSQPILNIHEAVKSELIKAGIGENLIFPPICSRKPELKLAGSMKQKDQDICVVPAGIQPNEESMTGGLLDNVKDVYGLTYTEQILCINVRSQISSIQKNFDTLYERTYAEAMNLHERCPKMCLGEVYMIAVPEYDDANVANKEIAFKLKQPKLVEKYIKSFQAINNRSSEVDFYYKYERACLLIVDFSQTPAKIYHSDEDLKKDGLLSQDSVISYEGLSFFDFVDDLVVTYKNRF